MIEKVSRKEIVLFDWECGKCLEKGVVGEDKIWRFCPYCGNKLTIKVQRESDC